MNYLLAGCLNFTFRSVLIIAITLGIMIIALVYMQGFGFLLLITLLVLDRVAHYFNKITVWLAVRAWRKML